MAAAPSFYFDNAATTPMDERVLEAMMPFFTHNFGNPSSTHSHGRNARVELEKARKKIAALLHTSPGEIVFTSGGTEADNMAIWGAISAYGLQQIISSPLEHHAVLHVTEHAANRHNIPRNLLKVSTEGTVNLEQLDQLLQETPNSLVTLMHGNNEIGNLNDLKIISQICQRHGAYLHSDTVQTVGHYPLDLQALSIHAIAGSAHKFHGPKGVGFLYINSNKKLPPLIEGGSQERNRRGGTENIAAIVGMAKALELAQEEQEQHQQYISELKQYFASMILEAIPEVTFNGLSGHPSQSLYTVLNVSFPPNENARGMLLFHLDLKGISASGGSACNSGARLGSHVLQSIGANPERESVRFSFSRFNTREEVDYTISQLKGLYTN
ncbi:cysteine desulfurase family protein [Cyclobacterium jeungdonense]|uniref:cysteine desulfurase n=1 Tax=Cyclobacterium jeungdonense TaxID=708087 RepID=A0ABT8C7B3_9BACT|nr:cysteine desulfurase family protein [Cyclobacterium jeungdonense]MDN3688027.1 cysteine desulfurase family protein [Cyclobacterium jeungdonense]